MRFFNKKPNPVRLEEKSSSIKKIRILTINGRKFVTGLFWQPLTNPRSYMSEARAIGKKRNWDIVAIRKTVRIQAGFVNKDAGVEKGMYSLAAALAGQLGDSWLGAFHVNDDEYAVVAVHDGSIVPGYDVVASRDEALNLLKQGYQLFQYEDKQIFAPVDFQFSQYEKALSEILTPNVLKSEYRLKQLTFGLTKKELVTVCMAALAFMVVLYGGSEYKIYKEKNLRAALQLLDTKNEQEVQAPPRPWAKIAKADDFTKVCTAEIYALPLNIAGWQIDEATCDEISITAIYRRKTIGTTVSNFIKLIKNHFSESPFITEEGNTAMVKRSVKIFCGDDEKLASVDTVKNNFLSYFQAVDVQLKLIEKQVALPPPYVADWRMFIYEFKTPISPTILITGLPDKNGVRVTKMTMKYIEEEASLTWMVTGELYAYK